MFPVAPMKAVLGSLPPDAADDQWAYEVKWDGYRCIAHVADGQVRLQSLAGNDFTATYPEIASLAPAVNAEHAVLDGELVVLDDEGRPSFELMQRHERPAAYYVFDVLQVDGHDTTALPYLERRQLLERLVDPGDHHLVPSFRVGDGAALFEATEAQGLEGIMAKRINSPYVPGKRSADWRKIKHRRQLTVTVGGYTDGDGNRAGTFGALLVGEPNGDALTFRGGIGTGFDQMSLERITAALRQLGADACPFDPPPPAMFRRRAHWVEPVLRAVVEMTELTNDGLIRHGSFVGFTTGETP